MRDYRKSETHRDRKFYKNSRQGKICGIFSGLGDYLGINPLILRILGIIAVLATGPIVILGYLLVSVLLDDNPNGLYGA
ncbi:PspC domain-containing protein [Paremcibacter congregatus]|uniref:PspC domain-containing protein n=1 Tax=Paremcibacter congregatus TaxID=2043170 RepID=A0A2G4YP44_9PROT|nr:PspC domain-containing protein [Paremcibacter congregatus]PHZ84091.1 PspC domain-containing protein [Paremcibacter congregatus]QDE25848.1 PspC domain-containing protein [Paremcibacter congregatus]|tara:strand:- start:8705 stop:8941 length:237 start_codon:yes stop_codon:yes gene_type:complete